MGPFGKQPLLDVIKGSITTLVLFLAFVTIPMVGLLPGIFAPLPAIYHSVKRGVSCGILIVAVTIAVLAIIGDIPTIGLYMLLCVSLSVALPHFLRQGKGAAGALAYSVAINILLVLVMVAVFAAARGVDIDRQVQQGIQGSIAQTSSFYEKAGLKGEELKTLQEGLTQAGETIRQVYPAMMIISLVSIAALNMLALTRLSARITDFPPVGSFRDFRNPEPLIWALIAAGFAMLLPEAAAGRIALNVLIVLGFMYFIQGLAVVIHFFIRNAVPPFLRGVFYVLLLVQPYIAIGLALIGIFDMWGNFRNPKPRQNL